MGECVIAGASVRAKGVGRIMSVRSSNPCREMGKRYHNLTESYLQAVDREKQRAKAGAREPPPDLCELRDTIHPINLQACH